MELMLNKIRITSESTLVTLQLAIFGLGAIFDALLPTESVKWSGNVLGCVSKASGPI
jgi:hypothetical protein